MLASCSLPRPPASSLSFHLARQSTNYNSGRNEFANTRSAPPAAAARPPPVVAAPTPAASQTDDDTWGEEPPSVPSARPTPTSAYTPKPAAVCHRHHHILNLTANHVDLQT